MEHGADYYFLKEGVRALSQATMEMAEVEEHLGAARHEERTSKTHSLPQDGYRERDLDKD